MVAARGACGTLASEAFRGGFVDPGREMNVGGRRAK